MYIYKINFDTRYYIDRLYCFEIYKQILKEYSNKYKLYEINYNINNCQFIAKTEIPKKIVEYNYKKGIKIYFY